MKKSILFFFLVFSVKWSLDTTSQCRRSQELKVGREERGGGERDNPGKEEQFLAPL